MTQPASIKDVFTTYSHNPEALKACREVMDIVESTVNEIIAKSKEVKAVRSAATKEAKPTTPALTPLQVLISQAPAILKDDLYAIRNVMMKESAEGMLDSFLDQTTPDTDRASIGQCLDELSEKHVEELRIKYPDILPRDLNRAVYQLAVLSLTDGATIAIDVILNQPKP